MTHIAMNHREARIESPSFSIAAFVTPHGYGHAARACGVMLALRRRFPQVHFDIFTEVPEWFFSDSLGSNFNYHPFPSDVGLVQSTPFDADLSATLHKLNDFHAHWEVLSASAAGMLGEFKSRLVLCDIAPLGIQAARLAGVPAVLVENFTWDFIYAGYARAEPGLFEYVEFFKKMISQVDLHIQAMPVCQPDDRFPQVDPVARPPRTTREEIHRRLKISPEEKVILVTTGGVQGDPGEFEFLKDYAPLGFIVPGQGGALTRDRNLIRLPHHSNYYSPDLVNASDAVISKLGYSTLAEVYQAGLPYAYIPRDGFAETPVMAGFARKAMGALELQYEKFLSGEWGDLPFRLINLPRNEPLRADGAIRSAEILAPLINL